jgi:hypothetical protein
MVNGGEPFKEVVKGLPVFQVVEQRLHGHTRTAKYGVPCITSGSRVIAFCCSFDCRSSGRRRVTALSEKGAWQIRGEAIGCAVVAQAFTLAKSAFVPTFSRLAASTREWHSIR